MITQKVKVYTGIPFCSDPDEQLFPPNINSMLHCIKRYAKQTTDPKGYALEQLAISERAKTKAIKGSKEGGKKE